MERTHRAGMTCARNSFFSIPFLFVLGLVCALSSHTAAAAPPPSPAVTPQQLRTRATDAGPLPLWDTSWWITVQATRTEAPLTRLEYTARFTDAADSRPYTGGWDLSGADVDALSGRVVVKCPARPDYEHHVRVQLRVRDTRGEASEWAAADFPVRGEQREAASAVPAAGLPGAGPSDERLGAVEVEATDDMTIGQTRAMLLRKARDEGGDAAAGLRLVRSTTDHATFAADVVRHKVAGPTPAAVSVSVPVPSERVIGEIVFHETRH
jgi:hypothetical protein